MQVHPQQFQRDGFVILRNVVPEDRLDELRDSFEILVERQKEIWANERKPGDPPGGAWETGAQPRLVLNNLVDETTANTVEFCLHENTLGTSRRLMGAPDAAVTAMLFMCSPVSDHGPARWHRDVGPGHPAPINGLVKNIRHHGPAYVQWNIALHDDSVLWVVPGSHLRPNTKEEDRQLAENPQVPLPESIPVELQAGDGVAYSIPILHWASNYSTRLRRIIHLGYRAFGGSAFSYVHWRHWDPEFVPHLSPAARETFQKFDRLWCAEHEIVESIFRTVIQCDGEMFEKHLVRLHSGETGRMVCIVMLSKLAFQMQAFDQLEVDHLAPEERDAKFKQHWFGSMLFHNLTSRFSHSEVSRLCDRFQTLDTKLKLSAIQDAHDFQRGPSEYNCNKMPDDFEVEDFIASW